MKLKRIILALLLTLSLSTAAMAEGKVDINTATQAELEMLNGIGATTASAIIQYRNQHGAYKSTTELMKVKGIGEKKLSQLLDNIMVAE